MRLINKIKDAFSSRRSLDPEGVKEYARSKGVLDVYFDTSTPPKPSDKYKEREITEQKKINKVKSYRKLATPLIFEEMQKDWQEEQDNLLETLGEKDYTVYITSARVIELLNRKDLENTEVMRFINVMSDFDAIVDQDAIKAEIYDKVLKYSPYGVELYKDAYMPQIEEERISILKELQNQKDEREIEKLHKQLLNVDQRKEELINKLESFNERNSNFHLEPKAQESMAKKMAEKAKEI